MRETKFRTWLSDTKQKENEQMLRWEDFTNPMKFWSNYYAWTGDIKVLMLYAGLKDKNGKEIYEGDIVKCHIPRFGDLIGVVVMHGYCWAIKVGDAILNFSYFGQDLKNIEVIGNIYENPELLEEVLG